MAKKTPHIWRVICQVRIHHKGRILLIRTKKVHSRTQKRQSSQSSQESISYFSKSKVAKQGEDKAIYSHDGHN